MSRRSLIALSALIALLTAATVAVAGTKSADQAARQNAVDRPHSGLPDNFVPAALRAKQLGRYFVVMDGPSVATSMRADRHLTGRAQANVARVARHSQRSAIAYAKSAGGRVIYRYDTLLYGFSANLTPDAAAAMAQHGCRASCPFRSSCHAPP